jgi:hypothetical protein
LCFHLNISLPSTSARPAPQLPGYSATAVPQDGELNKLKFVLRENRSKMGLLISARQNVQHEAEIVNPQNEAQQRAPHANLIAAGLYQMRMYDDFLESSTA